MNKAASGLFRHLGLWGTLIATAALAYACYLLNALLNEIGGYFLFPAALGCALLVLSVFHQTGYLRRLPSGNPLFAAIQWLTDGSSPIGMRSQIPPHQLQPLRDTVTKEHVRKILDENLFGQAYLTTETAREIEHFVGKAQPSKPLSIVVAGTSGSGKTSFAHALAAATALNRKASLFRIDCSADGQIDLVAVVNAFRGTMLPILLLDNFDRIGVIRHDGAFIAELTRLLDEGIISGKELAKNAVIIITVLIDPVLADDAKRQIMYDNNVPDQTMRRLIDSCNSVPPDILNRADIVSILMPLSRPDQANVVWKLFCDVAKREHGLTIVEDQIGLNDGIQDFLVAAEMGWQKAGKSGVHEAARFVQRVANDELIAAQRAGYSLVRPRWDAFDNCLRLDPVPPQAP